MAAPTSAFSLLRVLVARNRHSKEEARNTPLRESPITIAALLLRCSLRLYGGERNDPESDETGEFDVGWIVVEDGSKNGERESLQGLLMISPHKLGFKEKQLRGNFEIVRVLGISPLKSFPETLNLTSPD